MGRGFGRSVWREPGPVRCGSGGGVGGTSSGRVEQDLIFGDLELGALFGVVGEDCDANDVLALGSECAAILENHCGKRSRTMRTLTGLPVSNQSANFRTFCAMTIFTVSPGPGADERSEMLGEDGIERSRQAVERTAPRSACVEGDLMWRKTRPAADDIVMGDRVTPVVQSLQLVAPPRVTRVGGFDCVPEAQAKPVEVSAERSRLGVAAVELALKGQVDAHHRAETGRQSTRELPDGMAVQAAAVRLEVRRKQQDEGVVELQRVGAAPCAGSADGPVGLFELRQSPDGARVPLCECGRWHVDDRTHRFGPRCAGRGVRRGGGWVWETRERVVSAGLVGAGHRTEPSIGSVGQERCFRSRV